MWTLTNSTKLIDKMNSKQDVLTAWDYVSIDENNVIDTTYEFWDWIQLGTQEFDTKWPCPSGWHVPTVTEAMVLVDVLDSLHITTMKHRTFKMPKAWMLAREDATPPTTYAKVWVWSYFRMATVNLEWQTWWYILNQNFQDPYVNSTTVDRWDWCTIRPFKNVPVLPDNTWTVIAGSLAWVWVFWNSDLWMITCSADWQNYITIADKNLWATEVWEWWTAETPANCWLYYQYWNNHWFDWTEPSSTIEVDASEYWPGNYYDDWTFIMSADWDSNHNFEADDHRWWVATQWTYSYWAWVSNSWVLSVNWQTWNVTVNPVAMVVLDYWSSTWQDFINAYNRSAIVYCRVPSWSNWVRMAFLAYVAMSSWNPTNAEFQYVRSVLQKNATQQTDEVYIYKIQKTWTTWTTEKRNTAPKAVAWDWISLTVSWATHSPNLTITNTALQVSWVQPTAPTWYLWYDTVNEVLKVYDWTQWKTLAYAM